MNLRLASFRVVFPLIGGATFVLGACGSDEPSSSSVSAAAGSAGSAGSGAGRGGNAGNAGNGGNTGTNTAGAGGATSAGAAGAAAGTTSAGSAGSTSAGAAGASVGKKPGATCATDAECGIVGIETQPPGCAEAFCDASVCALRAVDTDGDSFRRKLCKLVSDGAFAIALGGDCDDTSKDVNPKAWDGPAADGLPNRCGDGVDQDCSGLDGDSVAQSGASCACIPGDTEACAQTDGGVPIAFPGGTPAPGSPCTRGSRTCVKDPTNGGGKWGPCGGAQGPVPEVCNNIDDDCDGKTDEEDALGKLEWAYDGDSDGFRAALKAAGKDAVPFANRSACGKPTGTPPECDASYCGAGVDPATCCPPDRWRLASTASALDCDDRDIKVNPSAPEVCGEGPTDKDDNCDGQKNELPAIGTELWFYDGDDDGFGDKLIAPTASCVAPGGGWKKGVPNTDCNDKAPTVNPGVAENCGTAEDDNCNGTPKDTCDCIKGKDAPLNCGAATDCLFLPDGSTCGDDGKYSPCPSPIEKKTYCPDADGDSYCDRTPAGCVDACPIKSPLSTANLPPAAGFLEKSTCPEKSDCADDNPSRSPGKAEICGSFDGGTDSDCDPSGLPDNGWDINAACDVGSGAGACKGAGTRTCAGASSTTCQAPLGLPSSLPTNVTAGNGSYDWSCDGSIQRGLYKQSESAGVPAVYPVGYQQGQFCVDVLDEGGGGFDPGGAPEFPQAPTPPKAAPWTSATCLHYTPDGTQFRVPLCSELVGSCTSHYFFEGCRVPAFPLLSLDNRYTCADTCGKAVKELKCAPLKGGGCGGSVVTTKWYSGCY